MPQYNGVWTLQAAAQAQSNQQWVTDPNFKNTTLLLQADNAANSAQNNTFLDSSTNSFAITRNGNTTQGSFTPFSQTGWSNNFNGSADYISAGTSLFNYTTANASTQTATIEAWVYTTAYGSPSQTYYSECIIGKGDVYMNFGINGSGNLVLTHYDGTQRTVTSSGTVSLNTWTYVACTISGGVVTLYINGSSSGTGTWFGIAAGGQNTASLIGRASTNASSIYFSGYLSNVRVSTNVRTITTPTIAYSSDGNTALLTCQSNRFVDNSSNAYALTLTGTPSVQVFSPFAPTAAYSTTTVGGSGYFDGTGDYLTATANAAFTFGTGDFTVEAWIYLTATGNSGIQCNGPASAGSFAFYVVSTKLQIDYYGGTSLTGASTLAINAWHHVAAIRSGSTLSIYLNGNRDATTTTASNNTTNAGVIANAWSDTLSTAAKGYFGGFRVIKGQGLYSGTTYTIPNAPLTTTGYGSTSQSITGTVSLLLNFTNTGIYDAAAKNDLETVGNAQVSTAVVKYGSGSMKFDGTGDYIQAINKPFFSLTTANFTIETWVYPTASSATVMLFDKTANSATYGTYEIRLENSLVRMYLSSTGSSWDIAQAVGTGTAPLNTWTHIALTRNGNTFTVWVNGIASGTTTSTSSLYTNTTSFTIGANADGSYPYTGYIDDFRFTYGIARYYQNFTPPQVALPRQ